MAIKVQEDVISLLTDHTMYQMKIDEYGVLEHLWYGSRTGQRMDYLLDYPDVGFAGNIYEAGNDRTYSLNTLPQEYACQGVGDYRVPAVEVRQADGSRALDLRYRSHTVSDGKYSVPGLPAVYASEEESQTLEVILGDTATDVEVILRYGVLPCLDVITRSVEVRNAGEGTVTLERVHSLCLDIPYGDWEWIHFHGRHNMERQPERRPLLHGIQESGSCRGTSSHQQNPAFLLCDRSCTETEGDCVGGVLLYSGGFQTQIELDQLDQVRVVMGIQPETFSWKLGPGESFHAPEVILSYSGQGMGLLSRQFHRVIREHVCRGKYQLQSRPILINNWEATYFDFDEQKILEIAGSASELGIDMLVLDDGWFGKRDGDSSGLGDWYVNEQKLKGGLKKLVDQINAMGMKFGIWFEPEMVSEDSELYRSHPDWAIAIPGRAPMRGRYQLVLDFSRQEVRDYIYESMCRILREVNISYVKWDMNRSISDWYSHDLPEDRQGELPHRYVLGLYEVLERLNREFPELLIEGCSGGGGRFDAGMLYYCPQIWCSDDTDAHERTRIQYGTSFFYPISAVGSHVSAVPNHQTGRIVSLDTRAVVAMAGSFGYELDLGRLSEVEKETVKQQICCYRQYQPLIHNGRYDRLTDPFRDNEAVWSFLSPDGAMVMLQGVVFRSHPNLLRRTVRLRGLAPEAQYRCRETGQTYTGAALMQGGILLPRTWGDDAAFQLVLERVEEQDA